MNFEEGLRALYSERFEFLMAKNKKYGNSALEPQRIFSKSNSIEQLLVRIDDKLSRIRNQDTLTDLDAIKDLSGYLDILQILINDTSAKNPLQ